MHADDGAAEQSDRVPRLAPACDPSRLELSPAEGYLLSRIDGSTSWRLLREIGGLPPEEVDRRLADWAREGIVVFDGAAPREERSPAPRPEPEPELAAVDPSLDIPVELQKRILAFEARLERPYHEILGVAPDADARTLKKAYFRLSREVHPDRYFRRNVGAFGPRLERCFKRLLEAYELLNDPATRKEVQRPGAQAPPPPPRADEAGAQGAGARAKGVAPEALQGARRKRLEARLQALAGPRRLAEERRRKARAFFDSGIAAFENERWLEAAGSVRLAIAFDPHNEGYRERFAEVQRRAHEERARQLVQRAESALDVRDWEGAFRQLEEASHYRPYDADLAARAARIAWQAGLDLRRAKAMAQSACEAEPERGEYRRLLGRIYKAAGLAANARRELRTALELDPEDAEAKAELRSL